MLHTHVLVANLARTVDDGMWRTLDSRRIYAHAKTAGTLYQAHLRHELTVRLGVGFGPVTNGYADLAVGIPFETHGSGEVESTWSSCSSAFRRVLSARYQRRACRVVG